MKSTPQRIRIPTLVLNGHYAKLAVVPGDPFPALPSHPDSQFEVTFPACTCITLASSESARYSTSSCTVFILRKTALEAIIIERMPGNRNTGHFHLFSIQVDKRPGIARWDLRRLDVRHIFSTEKTTHGRGTSCRYLLTKLYDHVQTGRVIIFRFEEVVVHGAVRRNTSKAPDMARAPSDFLFTARWFTRLIISQMFL